jgi:hypothetical protein
MYMYMYVYMEMVCMVRMLSIHVHVWFVWLGCLIWLMSHMYVTVTIGLGDLT